jgi:hypothetical protein
MVRFAPDSIAGEMWKAYWTQKDLGSKEPEEIQKEYVAFCRRFKFNAPCWVRIEPYPVPS